MDRQEVGIEVRPDQRGGDGRDPQTGMAPFFVVGAPRSGTTLLRVMLDRHPDLAIPPGSHFIPRLWARRRRYGKEGVLEEPELFLRDLVSERRFRDWEIPIEAVREELEAIPAPTVPQAIESAYRAYARRMKKRRWGDKTAGYTRYVPLLARLFPDARFVHLIRDGRDVALSQLALKHLHSGTASAAYVWSRTVRRTRRSGRTLGDARYTELLYEDLLDDPEGELRRLCVFLDLPFEPAMLEHDVHALEHLPLVRRTTFHSRIALPPTKGLRDWRREMSERQIAEFEAVAPGGLLAAGYELHLDRVPLATRLRAWSQVPWFGVRILHRRIRTARRRRIRAARRKTGG